MLRSVVLSLLLMSIGCSDPRLNAATEEELESSMEQVRRSLPEDRQEAFDEAVALIAMNEIDIEGLFDGTNTSSPEEAAVRARSILDGRSAAEIFAAADSIRAEQLARQRAQVVEELEELEEAQAAAARARAQLQQFEVTRARFYKRAEQYSIRDQPIIELGVRNGTAHAVSRAYFEGTLATPGRSVPWLKETFNYSISGGLEPGEDQSWSLAPNSFSEWGTVNVPADAVFTVDVLQIDGADGESLFSTRDFGERQVERLTALRAQLREIDGDLLSEP